MKGGRRQQGFFFFVLASRPDKERDPARKSGENLIKRIGTVSQPHPTFQPVSETVSACKGYATSADTPPGISDTYRYSIGRVSVSDTGTESYMEYRGNIGLDRYIRQM